MGTSFSAGARRHSSTTTLQHARNRGSYQQSSMTVRLDPAQMDIFRKKFMDTAKTTYIGVPYAKNLKKFPSCEC